MDNQGDHIGQAIITKAKKGCPAILLSKHGVFTFAETPAKALRAAIMLEYVAMIAKGALEMGLAQGKLPSPFPSEEAAKWYARHHGGGYGQADRD